MNSIDKNDVDISKLFAWGKKVTIKGLGSELDVFIRLVGDADVNRARVFALRKAAELRKKLHDEKSDERIALLPTMESMEKEVMVKTLLLFYQREFTMQAIREVKIDFPKEPKSEASQEEHEKYQAEIDTYPEKREVAIRSFIENLVQKKEAELTATDTSKLYNDYIRMMINQICESEMMTRYREICIVFGSYRDENYKKSLFKSFDEFDNLPVSIKQQFLDAYSELELDTETLKK